VGSGGSSGNGGGGSGGSTGSAGTSGNAGTSGGAGEGGRGGGAGAGGTGGAGAGGTGGAGGSGGATAGASGTGGAAGARGGAGGSGGAAGAAGSGGASAGASGTTGAGGTSTSSLRLEYQNSSSTATTFAVRLTNVGPAMPLISAIKVRYYFRDDSTNRNATPQVKTALWNIAGTSTPINLQSSGCLATIGFATPPQSSYADYGCTITAPMNANDTITFTLAIDPATQLASNDYSYADTAGAFAANDHLLILLNGVTVAGTAP